MADVESLIARARELAGLREGATPGPWKVGHSYNRQWWWIIGPPVSGPDSGGEYYQRKDTYLMAASWDMAALLAEMADEIEKMKSALEKKSDGEVPEETA